MTRKHFLFSFSVRTRPLVACSPNYHYWSLTPLRAGVSGHILLVILCNIAQKWGRNRPSNQITSLYSCLIILVILDRGLCRTIVLHIKRSYQIVVGFNYDYFKRVVLMCFFLLILNVKVIAQLSCFIFQSLGWNNEYSCTKLFFENGTLSLLLLV